MAFCPHFCRKASLGNPSSTEGCYLFISLLPSLSFCSYLGVAVKLLLFFFFSALNHVIKILLSSAFGFKHLTHIFREAPLLSTSFCLGLSPTFSFPILELTLVPCFLFIFHQALCWYFLKGQEQITGAKREKLKANVKIKNCR